MKKTFKLISYGAIGALFVLSTPLSFAPPDPDIFDGTKYKDEQEKQSLIRQMITKRPQFGRPGPFNSEGKPNAQGGMSEKQNQKGQEQGGQGQTQNQQQQASGQEGDQQGGGGGGEPSEEVEEGAGGALGGELDEEKELPPEQQGGGGMAGEEGEEQLAEGAGGALGGELDEEKDLPAEQQGGAMAGMESMDPGSLEDMQQAMGGGELEEAKKMTNAIQLGSPAEMIEMAEELKRQGEQQQLGQVEGSQESQSNRPMAGRNKGLSRGVESGESISTEL